MRMTAAIRAPRRSPFLQVAKSAIAAIAAWLLAGWLIPGPLPVFAAIAALLVVQPSVNQSLGKAVERSVGVITGVLVASLLGIAFGSTTWVVAVAIAAALLLSWALKMTSGTANQVAISALLVLALGGTTPDYALDRTLETILGAAIGFVVNVVVVPPLSLAPAHRAVDALGAALADALERLAAAFSRAQTAPELDTLLARAREVRPVRDAASDAIAAAADSLTLNPRARRHRDELRGLTEVLDRFTPIVTQTIGMTRAFCERYDPSLETEPTVRAIAEQLRRAAHDVRLIVARGESGADPVAAPEAEQPALTTPLQVAAPSADHWVLVGSLVIDLLRIHHALTDTE